MTGHVFPAYIKFPLFIKGLNIANTTKPDTPTPGTYLDAFLSIFLYIYFLDGIKIESAVDISNRRGIGGYSFTDMN